MVRTHNLQTPSHLQALIKNTVRTVATEGLADSVNSLLKTKQNKTKQTQSPFFPPHF